jgi:hypothetical protein
MIKNLSKVALLVPVLLIGQNVEAKPQTYIEMKSETSFHSSRRGDTTNHTRLGFANTIGRAKVYAEGGHMDGGHSFEIGYKFKMDDNLIIKGKFEGKKKSNTKGKLETEIRYTF